MSEVEQTTKRHTPVRRHASRPDPAITAARVLDRAATRYEAASNAWCTFIGWFNPDSMADWGDDTAIVLERLGAQAGPALGMLAELKTQLRIAEESDTSAFAALTAIQPTSTRGFRCYRAAVGRYARRLTGHAYDEAWALGRLSTESTTG